MAQQVVYRSEYYDYGFYNERSVAILRRTAHAFANSQAVLNEGVRLVEHFPVAAKFGVIVDMREAPAMNEPWFEAAQKPIRLAISRRFTNVVVLVSTSAGELQVNRIHHDDGAAHRVTRSDVIAWKLAATRR